MPQEGVVEALSSGNFRYQVGPFTVQLRSNLRRLGELFYHLYGDCEAVNDDRITDFHLSLLRSNGVRRWIRPQVKFIVDGQQPFAPFPADTGFPLMEWGLNWCIATQAHHYLMLHAAAVEKNGKGVLLPAIPGTGKSTLSAALVHHGWRLLSDEFGLIEHGTRECIPLPRCIPLKNESIKIIRDYCPDAVIGPTFPKTRKGDVAHLKPPPDSINRAGESAGVSYVVFPKYDPSAQGELKQFSKARAFIRLSSNSFNYELLGERGFETVDAIIESSNCYLLHYNHLDGAIAILDDLIGNTHDHFSDSRIQDSMER